MGRLLYSIELSAAGDFDDCGKTSELSHKADNDSLTIHTTKVDSSLKGAFQFSSFFPYGKMRQFIPALLASAPIALASQPVFSVHDDLLAFPQVSSSQLRMRQI